MLLMLTHWFSPISEDVAASAKRFCKILHEDAKHFPLLDQCQLVFVGFDKEFSDNFREIFYKFENHTPNLSIADIGNFINIEPDFVIPALKELIDSGIIPILLGAPNHIVQKLSHRMDNNVQTIHAISNRIPHYHTDDKYEIIGFQRHLCALDRILELEEVSLNSMSLANLRAYPSIHEAVLRDAKYVHFDGNAIKLGDNPASSEANTSGLTCAEACQTMKYIGGSHHLKFINIFNAEIIDQRLQYASNITMAEAIWYFLEGISQKSEDHPFSSPSTQQFVINSLDTDAEIKFTKNINTGRWWFETSSSNSLNKYISCSYEEYLEASQGDIPDRLMRYLSL